LLERDHRGRAVSESKPTILIATRNAGKLSEFERLLGDKYVVEGLADIDLTLPDEGTESYQSNAETKAVFVAAATGRLTLGDDSGIEALALGGEPGIISARYAGEPVSDARNIEKLLAALESEGSGDRAARFVCWLALADRNGLIASIEGTCDGVIRDGPRGSNGFGYDPVFVFPSGQTMAEMSDEQKDLVSHRGNAVRSMMPVIATEVAKANGDA
jgi:XTP/dITP diphosphohydrolase